MPKIFWTYPTILIVSKTVIVESTLALLRLNTFSLVLGVICSGFSRVESFLIFRMRRQGPHGASFVNSVLLVGPIPSTATSNLPPFLMRSCMQMSHPREPIRMAALGSLARHDSIYGVPRACVYSDLSLRASRFRIYIFLLLSDTHRTPW